MDDRRPAVRTRRAMLAGLAVVLVAAATASAAPARPVTVGHAALAVPCGGQDLALPADWYRPRGRPTGLAWVQHGFLRTKANVATVARAIAARTGAVVVAPTIDSNPFAPGGCWINGVPMQEAVARLFADRSALRRSARAAGARPVRLPRRFVLVGHSAGGNLAVAAAAASTAPGGAVADLRGVVGLDAVDFAGQLPAALARLTGANDRPVLQVAAPPSPCNAFGAGTQALVAARPGRFVGVELAGGTHVDAEGPDSDPLARAICGTPLARNVRALRTIAAAWVTNALTGASTGITTGAPGERIAVGDATAVVLGAP